MINTIPLQIATMAGAAGKLKYLAVMFMALTLLTATGCRTTNVSSKGGFTLDEQFSITVPARQTLRQGSETPVNIVLDRGPYFKRDVQLDIKTEGIDVNPNSILVKASDPPQVQLLLGASREAALGEYRVTVTGTPSTGKPAATLFIVRVIAQ